MKDHRLIDERSRAFGEAIAARLKEDPRRIERARANIARWLESADPGVRAVLLEWRELLNGPMDDLLNVLTRMDDRCIRLRQSNPFAGELPPHERNSILRRFARHESTTA